MKITLRKAGADDIPLIARLADTIWRAHYTEIIGLEQVEYMLNKMYNPNSLFDQIQHKLHVFYLVILNEEEVGFISISNEGQNKYMLNKFYLLQNLQGKGLGTLSFQQLLEENPDIHEIRLTVNRQNFKSINFYFKLGFKIEKVADFDIGDGYFMNDFVMIFSKKKYN